MPAHQPTWTTERIERLKIHFADGLSCRQIADQIGVTRNAVIGKISRLQLTRDKAGAEPLRRKGTKGDSRKTRKLRLRLRLRLRILRALPLGSEPAIEDGPIHNGHCCSLFELSNETCRWPISTPGADDFCFCGNPPLQGLPYCAGHSRLAYRVSAR